jgi:C4-dicarboxylate transporter DctM subunit
VIIATIVIIFFLFAALGMPIAFAMGMASLTAILVAGMDFMVLPGKMVHAVDSFPLMAIPLFMLAGQLMLRGGIMDPLIDFVNALIGRVRGGLAHVTVASAMLFSSVSGVAVADATALGGALGPALSKTYPRPFAASIVAAASCMGPIIPPSGAMIVYAVMAGNVSVAGLFLAGIVPGVLIGISMMGLCTYIAYRRGYPPTGDAFNWRKLVRETLRSIPIFLMPIIVIGGIIAGAFTPTEGAAIAVAYALLIGFFFTRKLKLADLPVALFNAAIVTAVVGALIAFSTTVTYLFTIERVADLIVEWFGSYTTSPYVFICLVMVALLVLGAFVEGNSLIIMVAPVLAPVALSFGLDPIYFGFLFVMNIVLGSITPPVGILLFVTAGIWNEPITNIIKAIWPFIVLLYSVLVLLVLVPDIFMFLPKLMGFAK